MGLNIDNANHKITGMGIANVITISDSYKMYGGEVKSKMKKFICTTAQKAVSKVREKVTSLIGYTPNEIFLQAGELNTQD